MTSSNWQKEKRKCSIEGYTKVSIHKKPEIVLHVYPPKQDHTHTAVPCSPHSEAHDCLSSVMQLLESCRVDREVAVKLQPLYKFVMSSILIHSKIHSEVSYNLVESSNEPSNQCCEGMTFLTGQAAINASFGEADNACDRYAADTSLNTFALTEDWDSDSNESQKGFSIWLQAIDHFYERGHFLNRGVIFCRFQKRSRYSQSL